MTPKPCFLTPASALHSRTCAPNLARRFAAKHPPYPTKPTTARALDSTRFEQARQILVRRFAFTNPPIPTKPTTVQAVDSARFEQARQILVRRFAFANPPIPTKPTSTADHCARPCAFAGAIKNQPKPTSASYTCPVTSKKGVIGIGVPPRPCSESRRTTVVRAAFSLAPPVLAARMGGRKARRSRQGLPVRQPVRAAAPNWRWVRRFLQTETLEAIHG